MNKEYPISKLSDFLSVPEDRMVDCLIDFHIWLAMARSNGHVDQIEKSLGVEPGAIEFITNSFIWIDDGKHCISAVEFSADGREVARLPIGGE